MPESRADSRGPQDAKGNPPPVSDTAPLADRRADAAPLAGDNEPSDDAPTVISRSPPPSARPEEAFATTLRGRRLAHFELVEPIGVGGMAAVIHARDTQLDRNVALKILPPEMAADPEIVRRFQQEARAAAKLDHENIARVFFCGEDQGLHFISFEFVEGENLRTILERRGRVPVREAVNYMLQIATGLAHAAERGVVHRDIKPSNIIISPTGRAKLVDMGLARSREPQVDHALTQSGVTLGTFDYISPEQAMEPREADVRSDIYSLGCTFYHMLTGQPPVPEGTAAKKLHHHQHVAPLDPRQLNPEIPDDVAAVLARMMAKDPKDRYQDPVDLVRHLFYLVRQLGAPADAPEGVLYVDAPLPNPPRMRPVLVGLVAAVVLVGLVALHGLAPQPPSTSPHGPPVVDNGNGAKDQPPPQPAPGEGTGPNKGESPKPARSAPVNRQVAHTGVELAALLRQSRVGRTDIVLAGYDWDLSWLREGNAGPGLVLDSPDTEVVLRPENPQRPPTIKLKYVPSVWGGGTVGACLTVRSGRLELQDLRFEVDATQADITLTGLRVQPGGSCLAKKCEFIQANPPMEKGRLSSVAVEGSPNGNANSLELEGCYFNGSRVAGFPAGATVLGGQDAVTLVGASVRVENCAFGPHVALFHLQEGNRQVTQLTVSQCSAFLTEGNAFLLDDNVTCRLDVQHSLFSTPEGVPGATTLIQQGDLLTLRHFSGVGNCYHNLGSFWLRGTGAGSAPVADDFERFQTELRGRGDEDRSTWLTSSPWVAGDPLLALREDRPAKAFQVNEALPELRRRGRPDHLVGIEACAWGPAYGPLPAVGPAARVVRVVDPNDGAGGAGIFATLNKAVADAKPQEIIQIKERDDHRPIEMDLVRLEKADVDVTLMAYPGHHPVLILKDTSEQDGVLFKVHDSKVTWEGLEFLVQPSGTNFKAKAVAALTGAGVCTFKNCVITLAPRDGNDEPAGADPPPVAAVLLTDPKEARKMESTAPPDGPKVRFVGCFVRGKGDLVLARASRPFVLDNDNTVVALAGSFLHVEGNAQEPADSAPMRIALKQVTAYLSENLILLHTGKSAKDLVRTDVKQATRCLFASAGGKSLVHFEGDINDDQQMRRLFSWEGQANCYVNYSQRMVDQKSAGPEMPLMPYGKDSWPIANSHDDARWLDKDKFYARADEQSLAQAQPDDFGLKSEQGIASPEFGADLSKVAKPVKNK
jgi:serine/threonine protein kinase